MLEIIGIESETTIIFDAKSILFAIEFSPKSLQILTAYSARIAIPVIFKIILIKALLYLEFETIFTKKLIIYSNVPIE